MPPATSGLLTDAGFPPLKDYIVRATGLAYYNDKDDDLAYRIGDRISQVGHNDCATYLELLQQPRSGDEELDQLVKELTVGETSFFRHSEVFEGLRTRVLPHLLERNRASKRLRLWSAGSSIGAEVYSLAILLADEFGEQLRDWDVSIVGTDINRTFLARARDGVFGPWDFRGVDVAQIENCFTQQGEKRIIRPEYRRWVNFQYHNLVRDPFPSLLHNLVAFDLIFCRNVLIYFSPEIGRRLVGQFHASLLQGGWLLVGHAEPNMDMFRAFQTVNVPGAVLYQKTDGSSPQNQPAVAPVVITAGTSLRDFVPTHKMTELLERPRSSQAPVAPRPAAPAADEDRPELAAIQQMADAGELEPAMQRCAAVIARSPMNPAPHFCLAMLAEQLGDHHQAEVSLRRTLYLNPRDALAHYYFGLLQQKRGRRLDALRSYGNVLSFLTGLRDDATVGSADTMTVNDLRELTQMQQEVLQA